MSELLHGTAYGLDQGGKLAVKQHGTARHRSTVTIKDLNLPKHQVTGIVEAWTAMPFLNDLKRPQTQNYIRGRFG